MENAKKYRISLQFNAVINLVEKLAYQYNHNHVNGILMDTVYNLRLMKHNYAILMKKSVQEHVHLFYQNHASMTIRTKAVHLAVTPDLFNYALSNANSISNLYQERL